MNDSSLFLISVIIPVYNAELYLKRCIECVISQTYNNLEIILVDDGSTDSSGDICDKYAIKDSRIKVFHNKNMGPGATRNYGFEVSCGDFIFYLDSDDYISDSCIEGLIRKFAETNADIVFARLLHVNSLSEKITQNHEQSPDVLTGSEAMRKICRGQLSTVSACGKLFKRSIIEQVKNPAGRHYEDLATISQYMHACSTISFEDNAKYYYDSRPGSITTTISKKSVIDYAWATKKFSKDCSAFFPELKNDALYFSRITIIRKWARMIGTTSGKYLLFPFLLNSKEKYRLRYLKALRRYIFSHLQYYRKLSSRRKLQAIAICFIPGVYALYIRFRKINNA